MPRHADLERWGRDQGSAGPKRIVHGISTGILGRLLRLLIPLPRETPEEQRTSKTEKHMPVAVTACNCYTSVSPVRRFVPLDVV